MSRLSTMLTISQVFWSVTKIKIITASKLWVVVVAVVMTFLLILFLSLVQASIWKRRKRKKECNVIYQEVNKENSSLTFHLMPSRLSDVGQRLTPHSHQARPAPTPNGHLSQDMFLCTQPVTRLNFFVIVISSRNLTLRYKHTNIITYSYI